MSGGWFPALSVKQPWAELIVSGRKQMEIRTWEKAYPGRIWIHAAGHADKALDGRFGIREPYRGGFIGSAELASIEPLDAENCEHGGSITSILDRFGPACSRGYCRTPEGWPLPFQ